MGLHPDLPLLSRGTIRLPKAPAPGVHGWRFVQLEDQLTHLIEEERPHFGGFESPFLPIHNQFGNDDSKRSSENTIRFLIGVDSIIETVFARFNIHCEEVHNSTVKKAMLGRGGRFTDADGKKLKPEQVKQLMKNACFDRGWMIADEHQADACGVGKYMIENYFKRAKR